MRSPKLRPRHGTSMMVWAGLTVGLLPCFANNCFASAILLLLTCRSPAPSALRAPPADSPASLISMITTRRGFFSRASRLETSQTLELAHGALLGQLVEFGDQPHVDIIAALGFGQGRAAEQIKRGDIGLDLGGALHHQLLDLLRIFAHALQLADQSVAT